MYIKNNIIFKSIILFLQIVNVISYLDVKLDDGVIRGQEAYDRKGQLFYSFRGVPYAKPPIGKLRFQPPRPSDPWNGIKETFEYSQNCPQLPWEAGIKEAANEDCLYLNVFAPPFKNQTNNLKAVMVYIFGGGFITGTSSSVQQGPENIVAEDIILITFNYRLGLYGFLKLNDPKLKIFGNMGFKDQVAVLKWIEKNIKKFGGDPKRVTLVGNSSGAMCVHAHMLSPLSKGLFHHVILQSGTALSLNVTIDVFEIARKVNANLGLPLTNEKDALKIFNTQNVSMTNHLIFNTLTHDERQYDMFGLVYEDPESPEPFMIDPNLNNRIFKNNYYSDVPMMIGYVEEEGIQDFLRFTDPKDKWNLLSDYKFASLLNKNSFKSTEERKMYDKYIIDYYLSNNKYTDLYNFFHLIMDLRSFLQIYLVVTSRVIYSKHPTFVYRFEFDTRVNYYKTRHNVFNFTGATHGDELGYIFRQKYNYPNVQPGSTEDISINCVTTLWSNFIKTGNPNFPKQNLGIRWLPVKNGFANNLSIGPKLKMNQYFIESDRLAFWEYLWSALQYNDFYSKNIFQK